jgi:glutathione synthase
MEMIETPRGVSGYLVRASPSNSGTDNGSAEKNVVRVEVISELGIFVMRRLERGRWGGL